MTNVTEPKRQFRGRAKSQYEAVDKVAAEKGAAGLQKFLQRIERHAEWIGFAFSGDQRSLDARLQAWRKLWSYTKQRLDAAGGEAAATAEPTVDEAYVKMGESRLAALMARTKNPEKLASQQAAMAYLKGMAPAPAPAPAPATDGIGQAIANLNALFEAGNLDAGAYASAIAALRA